MTPVEEVLVLAIGGSDEGARWLHLPQARGRAFWSRFIDPAQEVIVQRLHASSASGELSHPGEVPLASETSLGELFETLAGELGPDFRIHDVGLALPGGVRLEANEERSVRLEARDDEAFLPMLARLTGLAPARLGRLLQAIRDEALTERQLLVRVLAACVEIEEVTEGADRPLRGGPLRLTI